ncbi:MAG: hypothetical protein U0Q07_18145 [Acidimicrobiales bacterium]
MFAVPLIVMVGACAHRSPDSETLTGALAGAKLPDGTQVLDRPTHGFVLKRAMTAAELGRPADPLVAGVSAVPPSGGEALDVEVLVYRTGSAADARQLWTNVPSDRAYRDIAANLADHSSDFITKNLPLWRLDVPSLGPDASAVCLASEEPSRPGSACLEAAAWILRCDTVVEIVVGGDRREVGAAYAGGAAEVFGSVYAQVDRAMGGCESSSARTR